jgi:hypothetical protein
METRVHAKCLRSVASVRNYFREYRAKKKHEQGRVRDVRACVRVVAALRAPAE